MRIALLSDVHANLPALESVLDDLSPRSIDRIICAGDVVGYYPYPREVIRKFRTENITSVLGNHDHAVITDTPSNFSIPAKRAADWTRRQLSHSDIDYLGDLPSEIREKVDNVDIYVTHGSPTDQLNQYIFSKDVREQRISDWFEIAPDLIVLGHTHRPMEIEIEGTQVVNPGSVGQPRDGDPRSSYAIFDTVTASVEFHRVEYDIEETARETHKELPRKLADRLFEGK